MWRLTASNHEGLALRVRGDRHHESGRLRRAQPNELIDHVAVRFELRALELVELGVAGLGELAHAPLHDPLDGREHVRQRRGELLCEPRKRIPIQEVRIGSIASPLGHRRAAFVALGAVQHQVERTQRHARRGDM